MFKFKVELDKMQYIIIFNLLFQISALSFRDEYSFSPIGDFISMKDSGSKIYMLTNISDNDKVFTLIDIYGSHYENSLKIREYKFTDIYKILSKILKERK